MKTDTFVDFWAFNMDSIFGVNYFYVQILGFEKSSGFFKIKVSPEGNFGFSI